MGVRARLFQGACGCAVFSKGVPTAPVGATGSGERFGTAVRELLLRASVKAGTMSAGSSAWHTARVEDLAQALVAAKPNVTVSSDAELTLAIKLATQILHDVETAELEPNTSAGAGSARGVAEVGASAARPTAKQRQADAQARAQCDVPSEEDLLDADDAKPPADAQSANGHGRRGQPHCGLVSRCSMCWVAQRITLGAHRVRFVVRCFKLLSIGAPHLTVALK
jgi:hypothetical protein